MAGTYELWLTNDYGLRLALLDDVIWFSAGREVNRIGAFSCGMPSTFDVDLVNPDWMVQVWRGSEGGRPKLWRAYFLRRWRFAHTKDGAETITLFGVDSNDLLRRRIVAAYTGVAQASKTDFADDMLKEIVTEALADGVAPVPTAGTRVWGDLSVAADTSDGPTLTKAFAFDKLLWPSGAGVFGAIAKAAREAGTEVFFDVAPNTVASDSINFEFRTYTGQPGLDATAAGVLFSQEKGNLSKPYLEYDYRHEENYIYAGGQGTGVGRTVQQVYDTARYGVSQWNRCEGFADARNQAAANGVREAGRARLEAGRPSRRFGARLLDTSSARFGRDWDYGYKVRAKYRDIEFDTIVRSVVLSMDSDGAETVDARSEYED
jgi:hypothetical protein